MEKYFVIGGEEGGVLHHLGSVCTTHRSPSKTPRALARLKEVFTRGFSECEAKTSLPPWAAADPLSPCLVAVLLAAAAAVVTMVVIVCLSFEAKLVEDITFKYVFQM